MILNNNGKCMHRGYYVPVLGTALNTTYINSFKFINPIHIF